LTVQTQLRDTECLLAALCDMGWSRDQIEVYIEAQPLYGYKGDVREQTAEIVIRRKFIGSYSNDVGFKKNDDGFYEAIISEYDRGSFNSQWTNKLTQRYTVHKTKKEYRKQGKRVLEEALPSGKVRLTVTGWS
jgi:hypothetical protein